MSSENSTSWKVEEYLATRFMISEAQGMKDGKRGMHERASKLYH